MNDGATIRVEITSPNLWCFDMAYDVPFDGDMLEYRGLISVRLDRLSDMAKQWVVNQMFPAHSISPIEEVINEIGMAKMRNRLKRAEREISER